MANAVEIMRGEGGNKLFVGSVPQIDLLHKLIHEGRLFYINRRVRGSASAMEIHIKTGSKNVHLDLVIKAGLASPIDVIEDVTATGDGTAVVCRNYNRAYADDGCVARAFHTPTYTGGTVIRENQAGFGTSQGNASSGESDGRREYDLLPNKSYVIKIAPTASTDVVFIGEFYEV
jgi:hypothetical protein